MTLFSCQQHGDNNSNYLTGLLRRLKEVIPLKSLTHRLGFYKPSGFLVLISQPPTSQLAPFLPLLNFNCSLLITQVGDSHKSIYEKSFPMGPCSVAPQGALPVAGLLTLVQRFVRLCLWKQICFPILPSFTQMVAFDHTYCSALCFLLLHTVIWRPFHSTDKKLSHSSSSKSCTTFVIRTPHCDFNQPGASGQLGGSQSFPERATGNTLSF